MKLIDYSIRSLLVFILIMVLFFEIKPWLGYILSSDEDFINKNLKLVGYALMIIYLVLRYIISRLKIPNPK